ncbi:lipopolysaccharide heptosyltransferase II [Desulfovibrio ferrophilus]|uniref:lipopolysaccharide heptosyltransferase II n=1 Tax=Desulfovibrio ferrophilus TaxID=241368 RepID=A0A2Z6AYZ1_9BACT|nr:lipopolysaccharide heptosyltransferase II [Desulfovibrio ferrophilus]BBD08376.1 lipopolysaccharide heptosyltransferase II [Desulfovibrio ferrophilus]
MKIGIWNTAFLGDAILTLPLIHTLARAYPDADLHFYVRKGVEPLFAAQPELAAVHGFAKRGKQKGLSGAYAMGRDLSRQGFDLWISPHTSLRSGLIARWSSIPRRIGYNRPRFNSFFYTHTVDRAFARFDEIERLLRLTGPLDLTPVHEPTLVLPDKALANAAAYFHAMDDAPVLGIHPGSTWPTKQWPEAYFSRVIDLAVEAGARVLVFGGPGEEDVAARVVAGAQTPHKHDRVADLSGHLSLPELAAWLKRLNCYLTGDSGPMHLAWVQGTPVTAIFGPTVKDLGFFPRGERSTVIETSLDCRPCSLHGPKQCPQGHHRCMRDLSPEHVFNDVAAKLDVTHG